MEEELKTPVTEAAGQAAETTVKEAGETAEVKAESAESMADHEAELDATLRTFSAGEKVTGTVIAVDDDQITVDLNNYTDGIVRRQDISDDPHFDVKAGIQVGQEIEATVIRQSDHGHVGLSMKAAAAESAWERLTNLLDTQENVTVTISGTTKAGAIAYLEGVRAFIPASKLSLGFVSDEELESWVGKSVEVRVITAEEDGKKLVLSAKDILREKEAEDRKKNMTSLTVGSILEGTVETIKDYGAFVSLGKGVTGLLHVSQISQKRLKTPAEVLKEGQKVKVKITKIADGRISLSMKALENTADAELDEHISYDLPKTEEIGTGLAGLLKGLKLS